MLKLLNFHYSTFVSLYGQAGSVNFNLINGFHQVNLRTHWEDNCEYQCIPEEGYLFEDANDKSEICNSTPGQYTLNVNMPEYYNYSGNINGNLHHQSTNIDAKLYGNINISVSENFQAQKIKSEICNIQAKTLVINSTLETQSGQLLIQNDVNIKKLLISKQLQLIQEGGNLEINAGYVQRRPQQQFPILYKHQYLDYINQSNHIDLVSKATKIKFGTFSGGIKSNMNGKSFVVKSLSGIFHINEVESVELGITNQQSQGYIKAQKITLNIFDQLKFNIFKNGASLAIFDDQLYSIYTECEELNLQHINNPFGIV